jgi:hypothetical protein
LTPYFEGRFRPIHEDDVIKIRSNSREAEFDVLLMGPFGYGIIGPDTHIKVQERPIELFDENSLHEKLIQEIRQRIDYITSDDYGSKLCAVARLILRLQALLQTPPPPYEEFAISQPIFDCAA